MDAKMDDSASSVHFHSAVPAVTLISSEDQTAHLSPLSSLTITGGFSIWDAARRVTGPNAAAGRSPVCSPSPYPTTQSHQRPPTQSPPLQKQQQQPHVGLSNASEDGGSDVLWHVPPPPPPPSDAGGAPVAQDTHRKPATHHVVTALSEEDVVAEETGRVAQVPKRVNAQEESPSFNRRRYNNHVMVSPAPPTTDHH